MKTITALLCMLAIALCPIAFASSESKTIVPTFTDQAEPAWGVEQDTTAKLELRALLEIDDTPFHRNLDEQCDYPAGFTCREQSQWSSLPEIVPLE